MEDQYWTNPNIADEDRRDIEEGLPRILNSRDPIAYINNYYGKARKDIVGQELPLLRYAEFAGVIVLSCSGITAAAVEVAKLHLFW